jgi:ABC-type multidrug transport system fused ATPase/permease subunit
MALATLASMTVRLGIDTDALREGVDSAKQKLAGLGKGLAGLGIGVPVAAAVAAGVGGVAAAFASAGVAAKAFQLAVGPQMQDVADAASLAEEAEKAAASGAEDAAEKQKAYTDALAQMPPHTRAMAKEFIGLKKDHQKWSDSLSSTTMPVFTKGLQVVRRLLPLLTPFVKEASKAFGAFVDEIDRSTKGKGLESFAKSMAKVAGGNLKSFLFGLKNIASGIGGIIKAFLPMSDEMSGGFEKSTAAFAKWGQGLSKSEGFAQFVALAKQGAQALGTLAQAVLKLVVALAPFIGIAAAVALQLAKIVNALPPEALNVLAGAVLSAVIAFKAFKAASSAVETVSDMMNSRLGQVARRWVTTAATAIKSGARIAASAVAQAARTAAAWTGAALRAMARFAAQMIRTAAIAVAQMVRMAARAVIWAATMAAQWLIAMGPVGWIIAIVIALVALIIANWDKVKAYTAAAWNWAVAQIKGAVNGILAGIEWLSRIPGKIASWFGQAKDWAVRKALALVAWVTGLPGRVNSALAGLLGVLRQRASTAFQALKDAAVKKALTLVSWARGLPGKIMSAIGNLNQLLVGAGRALIQGLIDGIAGMVGSLKSKLSSVTNMLPDWKGPMRVDLRLLAPSGAALMTGFMDGIAAQTPALRSQLQGITNDIPGMTADVTPAGVRRAAAAGRDLTVKFVGSEDDFNQFLRRSVTVLGGGSVQRAYGQGR